MTTDAATGPRGLGERSGVLAVAVGLGVFGLAGYGYLWFVAHALGAQAAAPVNLLWTLLNAVGIGLFLPLEQQLGRTTASLRARGLATGAAVRAVGAAGVVLLGGTAVVCLASWPLLAGRLFGGRDVYVPLLVAALGGAAVAYAVRGLLSGSGRYPAYGAQLAVDGVLRVAGAGALAALGVRVVAAYALVLVLAPFVAVLVTTRRTGLVTPGGEADVRALRRAVGALVLASLASQLLANLGPVVVQLRTAADQEALVSSFTVANAIARVPLFAFAAVQAVLLPGLASLLGSGDVQGYRRRLALVGWVTGALAAVGTLAVWALGDWLLALLFPPDFAVGREVFTLLALSGGLFMLAQVAAQALLAQGGDRPVLVGWALGLAAFVTAALVPGEVITVASVALVVGSGVAFVALALPLLASLRSLSRQEQVA
ncbi:polysaccharide biosynthesis protein [Cellulomonas flavigena DSM 20109]|uniref:Polysaccharide biosynthesis protein n=1 Tax=Cellulomonas flavigena (strain ATCC 482 / DSM 20109 / BCRC 11376 / JCM 18109 / NBRC 3775 / NCIMB 8073 / NRS 134) TaxID=446466 RepID=D5UHC2_CELFN|nr:polysaccharide biosynthesis protein [Cellulomonas flavigena]ADG75243.1 polysaccharide biosynthesis protein [Cellulomonas flavigena DSM 20109]